jgi:hypothetical protein
MVEPEDRSHAVEPLFNDQTRIAVGRCAVSEVCRKSDSNLFDPQAETGRTPCYGLSHQGFRSSWCRTGLIRSLASLRCI